MSKEQPKGDTQQGGSTPQPSKHLSGEQQKKDDRYFLNKIVRANIGRPSELINQFEAFQKEVAEYLAANPTSDQFANSPDQQKGEEAAHKEANKRWQFQNLESSACRGAFVEGAKWKASQPASSNELLKEIERLKGLILRVLNMTNMLPSDKKDFLNSNSINL